MLKPCVSHGSAHLAGGAPQAGLLCSSSRPARRQPRFRRRVAAATNDEARLPDFVPIVPLGGDAYIIRSFVRPANQEAPRFDLDMEGALRVQMEALRRNNTPYPDHGVEVMYRFAAFDPFERSKYFGRSFDLGQFERFRRVFHTPLYSTLLNADSWDVVGRFQLGESKCALRVVARHDKPREEQTYTVTMIQRQGGAYDGYWMCESLLCDTMDWEQIVTSW